MTPDFAVTAARGRRWPTGDPAGAPAPPASRGYREAPPPRGAGGLSNRSVCPRDLALTTGSRTFPAGTYRIFGFYQDQAGRWHNLPEKTLTVTAAAVSPPFPGGTSLIWSEEFNGPLSADRWNRSTSSSYRYGSYNPDDDKPDRIDRRRSRSPTARPRSPPHPARSGSRAIGTPGTPVC